MLITVNNVWIDTHHCAVLIVFQGEREVVQICRFSQCTYNEISVREVSSVCDTHTFIATTGGGGKGGGGEEVEPPNSRNFLFLRAREVFLCVLVIIKVHRKYSDDVIF